MGQICCREGLAKWFSSAVNDRKCSVSSTAVAVFYDPRMMEHCNIENPEHPEQPARIKSIMEHLEAHGLAQRCVALPCREASQEELELKHTAEHVQTMISLRDLGPQEAVKLGKKYNSVYLCPASTQAALLSAGTVVEAAGCVCRGEARSALCVVRPPGHHAECSCAMGFCLFGNVAVAAAKARSEGWADRVLIVDWDVHHGNGTQRMFESDSSVLYFSMHRYDGGKFYPPGSYSDYTSVGTGQGEGFSVNVPWDVRAAQRAGHPAPGDAEWLEACEEVLMPIAADFMPDLVLVSAGFDSAAGDPLGGCLVSPDGYFAMTRMLMSLAQGRVVIALEGGYNLQSISKSMGACASALLNDDAPLKPTDGPCIFHSSTVHTVRQHLSKWWPALRQESQGFLRVQKYKDEMSAGTVVKKANSPFSPGTKFGLPKEALIGSVVDMQLALHKHAESTGADFEKLRDKQQDVLFRLVDIPQVLHFGVAQKRIATLRRSFVRRGMSNGPPFIVPVIHVATAEQAVRNVARAFEAGAHGVWLINFGAAAGGRSSETAAHEQLSALAECFNAVRDMFPDNWLGLNALHLEAQEAFTWVGKHCASADAIWLDELPVKPAELVWETLAGGPHGDAEEKKVAVRVERWLTVDDQDAALAFLRLRAKSQAEKSGWKGLVFGGVAYEYQEKMHHLQDSDCMDAACQALLLHWASLACDICDVVVTSGPGESDSPCSLAKLRAMSGAAPLAFSGGLTGEANPVAYLEVADVIFGATATGVGPLSSDGNFLELDEEKLREWVARWRAPESLSRRRISTFGRGTRGTGFNGSARGRGASRVGGMGVAGTQGTQGEGLTGQDATGLDTGSKNGPLTSDISRFPQKPLQGSQVPSRGGKPSAQQREGKGKGKGK